MVVLHAIVPGITEWRSSSSVACVSACSQAQTIKQNHKPPRAVDGADGCHSPRPFTGGCSCSSLISSRIMRLGAGHCERSFKAVAGRVQAAIFVADGARSASCPARHDNRQLHAPFGAIAQWMRWTRRLLYLTGLDAANRECGPSATAAYH